MFTEGDVAELRRMAESSMQDECSFIREGGFTPTPGGGGTYAPDDPVGPVACRLTPLGKSTAEQMIADQLKSIHLLTLAIPLGIAIDGVDEVTVNGEVYTVEAILPLGTFSVEQKLVVKGVEDA